MYFIPAASDLHFTFTESTLLPVCMPPVTTTTTVDLNDSESVLLRLVVPSFRCATTEQGLLYRVVLRNKLATTHPSLVRTRALLPWNGCTWPYTNKAPGRKLDDDNTMNGLRGYPPSATGKRGRSASVVVSRRDVLLGACPFASVARVVLYNKN